MHSSGHDCPACVHSVTMFLITDVDPWGGVDRRAHTSYHTTHNHTHTHSHTRSFTYMRMCPHAYSYVLSLLGLVSFL